MKIKLYMDIYKGQDDWFCANSRPTTDPSPNAKLFNFTVDIPDSAFKFDEGQFTHTEDFKEVL